MLPTGETREERDKRVADTVKKFYEENKENNPRFKVEYKPYYPPNRKARRKRVNGVLT
jgi:hypothetical protein